GETRAVKYCGVISAMGANSQSRIFYSRVKGEMEEYVISKNIKHVSIYRPSLLLGSRAEKRAGEKIATILMLILNPLLALFFKSFQAIAGKTVALAMFNESLKATPQKYTYTNKHLFDLAKI
ncbi:MAG: oxidoreductase, partial [Bacteroidetes bacterium]|nr:oxidoreductase [Bacteroidota bacterium]